MTPILENPLLLIISAIAVPILWQIVIFFLKHEKKKLDKKADNESIDQKEKAAKAILKEKEKNAQIREENLKSWVKITCGEMITTAINRLENMIEKSERKSEANYEKLVDLINSYKKEKHGYAEMLEGTIGVCNQALARAEKILKATEGGA